MVVGCVFLAESKPIRTYGIIMLVVGIVILSIHVLIAIFSGTEHFIKKTQFKNSTNLSIDLNDNTPIVEYLDEKNDD